jgi:two-component system chemotaxis response regulator CheB
MNSSIARSEAPVDVVALGASAGGLEPLRTVVRDLPADLPAAVLIVVHVSSASPSALPAILGRVSALPVAPASDGDALKAGHILVATPDHHLMVGDGRVAVARGPRENGHRPAIDLLFRSAARAYGPACCGVILSGSRDDGAAGLGEIKQRGGVAIVQDPDEAMHPGMPTSALAAVAVDQVLPADAIGPALVRLARDGASRQPPPHEDFLAAPEVLVPLTCPECGGSLQEVREGGVERYRCHVGHAYSSVSMVAEHTDAVERAMWTAARSLEDRCVLLRRLASRAGERGAAQSARRFEEAAALAASQSGDIRAAIVAMREDTVAEAAERGDLSR